MGKRCLRWGCAWGFHRGGHRARSGGGFVGSGAAAALCAGVGSRVGAKADMRLLRQSVGVVVVGEWRKVGGSAVMCVYIASA